MAQTIRGVTQAALRNGLRKQQGCHCSENALQAKPPKQYRSNKRGVCCHFCSGELLLRAVPSQHLTNSSHIVHLSASLYSKRHPTLANGAGTSVVRLHGA